MQITNIFFNVFRIYRESLILELILKIKMSTIREQEIMKKNILK